MTRHFAVDDRCLADHRLELRSSRRIGLRSGDVVVLFERRRRDVQFYAYATLVQHATEDDGRVFRAHLADYEKFEPADLSEFAFSLDRVWNTEEPYRHFTRRYTTLPPHDMKVLATGTIFWARTAIGLLLKELPPPVRLTIVATILARSSNAATDLRAGWSALREIIESDYLALAEVGVHAARNLEALDTTSDASEPHARDGARFRDLRLHDPHTGEDFDIRAQRDAFRALIAAFAWRSQREASLLDALTSEVRQEGPRDREFEERYRGRLWPFGILA